MNCSIHTSDMRKARKIWKLLGGKAIPVTKTGEMRYTHPFYKDTIRSNDRRSDVPAVLISRINQILRTQADKD
ncbi:MAG: hypothetical protein G3I11_02855 [Ferrovum sp.]|nr:hypothetical protein [Ferrovum sp.]